MAHGNSHYGDEDPVFNEDDIDEVELFKTAKLLGHVPDDYRDKEFAAKYAEWLRTAPPDD
jgi:hypothetical protein